MKPFFLFFCLLLSACATLTAEKKQRIFITTTPPGMRCTLHNAVGSAVIGATPGEALVERDFSPLSIACKSPTHRAALTATAHPETRGRAYANILLLGAPALVDAYTGAGYVYTPESLSLPLGADGSK